MAVPSLPSGSDRNAASGHLVSFTRTHVPADSVCKEKGTFLQPCPFGIQHVCAEGRAGKPLSQTAFSHCHSHKCSFWVTDKWKEDNGPQFFLRPPDCSTWLEAEKVPQGLGQVFSGHVIGLWEMTLISFSEVKMQRKNNKEVNFTLDLHDVYPWLYLKAAADAFCPLIF